MPKYIVVRNALGEITHAGEDNGHYAPYVAAGSTLTLEDTMPVMPQDPMQEKLLALPSITDFMVAYLTEDTSALAAMKDQYNLKKPK